MAVARQTPDTPFSLKITLADTNNSTSQEVYTSDTVRLTSDTLQNIEWSPREDKLLIPIETSPTDDNLLEVETATPSSSDSLLAETTATPLQKYIILTLDKQPSSLFLDTLLPEKWEIFNARWSPNERDTLYFIAQNSLWKIQIPQTGTVNPIQVAQDILGYDFYTDHIIVLREENHILYQYTLDTNTDPIQISTTPLSESYIDPHRIIVYDERKTAVINSQRELFIYSVFDGTTHTKQIGSSIDGAQFSNDGKKLLFWNDREVFVYFTEKWESQPQRIEDTTLQVAHFFDPIKNVQWTKDYEHILFSQGTELKTLSIDTRGGQEGFILKTLSLKNAQIFMSGRDNKIYFTDTQNDQSTLFSIDFPESTGFFGG